MPKPKQPTLTSTHKRLTTVFNRYIRLRDCKGTGKALCITCRVETELERSDAGHFVPGNKYISRYDERNVNLQCLSCNRFRHSNPIHYFVELGRKWGAEVPYELEASMDVRRIYSREELEEMIITYRAKVRALEGK